MDRRSGMWTRNSSGKSSAESDSSGSVSSYSERFSDEQVVFRCSPSDSSPNHAHSPEAASTIKESNEEHETVKSLTEKLSAALLDVAAKEQLVKQHANVTEEAISGWESAEAEVAVLKKQLEASSLKNSALEDRISHLDEALKECVRQLRQSREEQDKKLRDAQTKTHASESYKSKLEAQINELYEELEIAKTEAFISADKSFHSRLESLEKENKSLKSELLAQSDKLRICIFERDLSSQAAESASKQHLESIKRAAKLESECRRLRSSETRSSASFQRPFSSKGSGDVCNGQEKLTSWASALIAELDQFKHGKACEADFTALTEIDLMDDFLEMERLVAAPESDHSLSINNLNDESDESFSREESLRNELKALHFKVAELEKNIKDLEFEKSQLKAALAETCVQLEASSSQLALAGDELVDLRRLLCLADESKECAKAETLSVEAKRNEMESKLEISNFEIIRLGEKLEFLQGELDKKALPTDLEENIEFLESTREKLQSQLDSALTQAEELHKKVSLLEEKLENERSLSALNETAREELDIQLISAKSDLQKSNNSIAALEVEVREQKLLSAELVERAERAEAATSSLESQLESAYSEAERLRGEINCLQAKVEKEMEQSAEYSAKCLVLEEELSKRKRSAELWRISSSKGTVKLNKEKELAEAAGRFAECQKTIASLSRQLKSLTNIDEFLFEATTPESDECSPYLSFPGAKANHCNGSSEDCEWSLPPLSSSSSSIPGFARLLSRSRSADHVETL